MAGCDKPFMIRPTVPVPVLYYTRCSRVRTPEEIRALESNVG